MVESKGWNWDINQDHIWEIPSEDSYYYLSRWKNIGLTKLLDLGCGLGRHAIQFAQEGYEVDAFDISLEGLNKLRMTMESKNLSIRIHQGDMKQLPFGNNQFDCIFSYHCIYHTDKSGLIQVLGEIHRVLKQGGEMFVTLNSKNSSSFNSSHYPRIDDNTILKSHGAEIEVPQCYLDEHEVREVLKHFQIIRLRLIQDIYEGGSGWHFFIHARK